PVDDRERPCRPRRRVGRRESARGGQRSARTALKRPSQNLPRGRKLWRNAGACAHNRGMSTSTSDEQPARRFGWSDMFVQPDDDRDEDFNGALPDPGVVAEAWETWRAEVAFGEQYVADAPDLDVVGTAEHVLREVLVHMIEEYARHNGHADLLRERIDGRVGQ